MLIKGADWFVEGASKIAAKLGIPELVIGLTSVAMGTSAPEAAVSITASLKNNADIAIGNVLGSNILNILIILGITSVIISVSIQKSTLQIEIPFMIFITAVLFFMGRTGGNVSRIEGAILWLLFILYLVYLFILAKRGRQEEKKDTVTASVVKLILLTILGGVMIVLGSNVTVNSATNIAQKIGISERFIGLTIVALGTSLPELVTSVTAARKGSADIAIGNIVGSNLFNILFVIGTSAIITPVLYQSEFLIDGIIAIVTGVLLFFSVLRKKELTRSWGVLFLICYAAYFVYLLI